MCILVSLSFLKGCSSSGVALIIFGFSLLLTFCHARLQSFNLDSFCHDLGFPSVFSSSFITSWLHFLLYFLTNPPLSFHCDFETLPVLCAKLCLWRHFLKIFHPFHPPQSFSSLFFFSVWVLHLLLFFLLLTLSRHLQYPPSIFLIWKLFSSLKLCFLSLRCLYFLKSLVYFSITLPLCLPSFQLLV